jgi:hypothetical protein
MKRCVHFPLELSGMTFPVSVFATCTSHEMHPLSLSPAKFVPSDLDPSSYPELCFSTAQDSLTANRHFNSKFPELTCFLLLRIMVER